MPCYKPLRGYYDPFAKTKNGKPVIVFTPRGNDNVRQVELPCGSCYGCLLERSRQWAVRIMHEASLYENNAFVTLTYDDSQLPNNNALAPRDTQLFLKKLRRQFNQKIRFFLCGEYGPKTLRPHYHAVLFNTSFNDALPYSRNETGSILYSSQQLNKIWGKGNCLIGEVTNESAAYVAAYCLKKSDHKAKALYERLDSTTGEILSVPPEFTRMSRRPGIAADWLRLYHGDVLAGDHVITNGNSRKPPRFYDKQLEKTHPEKLAAIKERRIAAGLANKDNSTIKRLKVREKVKRASRQRKTRDKL